MDYNQFLDVTSKPITKDKVLNAIKDLACTDIYYQTDRIIIVTIFYKNMIQEEHAELLLNYLSDECSEQKETISGYDTEITEYIFQNFKVILINVI